MDWTWQEIQLLQQSKFNFEVLDFVRQYFADAEPLDEAQRFEASYAILPCTAIARPASTQDMNLALSGGGTLKSPPSSAKRTGRE